MGNIWPRPSGLYSTRATNYHFFTQSYIAAEVLYYHSSSLCVTDYHKSDCDYYIPNYGQQSLTRGNYSPLSILKYS